MPRRASRPHGEPGQAVMEYMLFLGLVSLAFLTMQVFARRWIQGTLKVAADGLSPVPGDATGELAQIQGMRQESGEAITAGPGSAQRRVGPRSVVARDSSSTTTEQSRITKGETLGGGRSTDYGEGAVTTTTGTSSTTVVSELK